jgi:prepilin-type N-terminal cleavage/methylation domain-containing protein
MLTNNTKRQSGFTIIEVLIVLAIAGLILLIVFLAVPALQRNSRNTQAKEAAAALLATVNEYITNNAGAMPTGAAIAADGTISITGGGATANGKTQGGFTATPSNTFPVTTGSTGVFTIAYAYKCNGNTGFTAAPRSTAVGFLIEGGGGNVQQCVES